MKHNKGLVVTTIIFGILVAVMGGYLIYENFLKAEYTYDDVKGLYTYTSETIQDEEGNEIAALYRLYLSENGTFSYKMGTGALNGHIGNYVIKGNTLVLNYLFRTDNGTGVFATTGSKTITITATDTLVDADPSITVENVKSAILKKASSEEESEYSKYEDVSYILSNYDLFNNVTNR